jgi:NodT family efflux transporter outer membrane factor (OMF) lipoprotein
MASSGERIVAFHKSCVILHLWRTTTIIGVVIALMLLSGCSGIEEWWQNGLKVGPNYTPPGAPVANEWIDEGDSQLKGGAPEDTCWWTLLNDPVLTRLIQTSYDSNLTLRAAGLRIMEARLERGIAVGNLFPQQQTASGDYMRNVLSGTAFPFGGFPIKRHFDDWLLGLNLSWELDFWGKFRRAIEAADANLDAQIWGCREALVLLQGDIATFYIQMRAFEERLALARKNLDLQKRTLDLVEARRRNGFVSDLDVEQAKANLATTQALIPALELGRRRMQNRLCVLLGSPPHDLTEELGGEGSIPAAPAEIVVGIPAELLRRRPDVRQAERQAAAQFERIGIAKTDFYPQIAITGTIGVESEFVPDLFKSDSQAGHVGPSFQWNILNYGRILNNVRLQDTRFQQAVVNLQSTVLNANEEVENAIITFLKEQVRVKSLTESNRAVDRAVQLAVLQYEKGVIDYQPVIDTQRSLVLQQDALAESRGLVAISLVSVYKALAGGWITPMAPENANAPLPPPETPLKEITPPEPKPQEMQ